MLGSGKAVVTTSGKDHVKLGSGPATISAVGGGSDVISGASSVAAGSGFTLAFQSGASSSTVLGGAGSYSIVGGSGGGRFTGGSAGNNLITGGSGNVTITGGGSGDTLSGGTGNDVIQAGIGNETLAGGGGVNEFTFTAVAAPNAPNFDVITDFQSTGDFVHFQDFGSVKEDAYASQHIKVTGGNTIVSLSDGSKVEFIGISNLSPHSFH